MIKLLLVDDEAWIRTSIKNKIDWNEELVLCAEASDGFEALNLAVNLRPDLVITDVRMPGMSGIEMLAKMKSFLPDIQSIFISGYNEFDYVKSAIELNASGYVLKPIRKEELLETLSRTIERIRKNNLLHRSTQTQLELMHKFLESYYNRMPVSRERFLEVLGDLKFHKDFLFVLLVRFFEPDRDWATVEQQLSAVTATLSHSYTCTVFPVRKGVYGIFLSAKEKLNLVTYSRNLIRQLQVRTSLDASISLGSPSHKGERLPEAFQSARDGLRLMHLYNSHEIILPNPDLKEGPSISLPKKLTQGILDSIYSHNLEDLKTAMDSLYTFLRNTDGLTVQQVNHILHLLLGNILQVLCEQDGARELADKGIALMESLSDCQPEKDLLQNFYSYCREAALSVRQDTSIQVIIQKAEQYLKDHYQEEISLKKMASLYYLNASYFSVSFKAVTGTNFNEYLTNLRMENAKRYLTTSGMRVNQVAHLVGYEDCSYFGKTFRKYTGLTPAEYQRKKNS